MKTTLEMPDAVFRRAKAKAAERGISLRQFVTEAVEEELKEARPPRQKPWMEVMSKLKHLRKENERINKIIEQAFERVDAEM
jgi:hypothetical protein